MSFAPLLEGHRDSDRGPIFWHYPHYGNQGGSPAGAMRDGDWKLIEFLEDGRLELYNLAHDLGEQVDLAGAEPMRTARMKEQLHAWRQSVDAQMPSPNPEASLEPTHPLIHLSETIMTHLFHPRRGRFTVALCVVLAGLMAVSPAPLLAQAPDKAAPIDVAYVLPDACVRCRAAAGADSQRRPRWRCFPSRCFRRRRFKQVGLDPLAAEQVHRVRRAADAGPARTTPWSQRSRRPPS